MSAADQALAAARRSDQPAFISLHDPGPPLDAPDSELRGMPFAIKDNLDLAGVPTTAGCPTLTRPAARDAVAVARLLAAGAVAIGKTNMDQFATGLVGTRSPYGACHSVRSELHVSGGSSSGSAVAVAEGVVPLALGTDTAGSGRVPAAFNGLVGVKPTRGLIPVGGVFPASPSLDCVTTLTRDVATARAALAVLVGPDAGDPRSRAVPAQPVAGVAAVMRVVGVPDGDLDLDEPHAKAWQEALAHLHTVARPVPIDITPLLQAARLLYQPPLLAERLAAFGHLLEPDGPHLDPVVRSIVLGARAASAADVFTVQQVLAGLRAQVARLFVGLDAVLLPVTPGHPTLADVAADPIGVNARLGTYTNMVNLLDLCAVAVPAGCRDDGLPFGVQLLAPAFADRPLLELAARWCGEPAAEPVVPAGHTLLAVAGMHLGGQPSNPDLLALGARLHARARTASGYRMYALTGTPARPGLVLSDGPERGIEVEVWQLPDQGLGRLAAGLLPPLGLGRIGLDDGSAVTGFVADAANLGDAQDISVHEAWRRYLDDRDRANGAAGPPSTL